MKSIRRVFIFLIIAFLLTTPSVIAQEKDPPTVLSEPSQDEPFLSEAPLSDTFSPDNFKTAKKRYSSASPSSTRGVTDVTDVLCLSCEIGPAEMYPAVAYGGSYYVMAFEESGTIHANVFYSDGSIFQTISNIEHQSYNADVAYDASTGLFIIVWKHDFHGNGSNYDIHAVALSPTSGLVGSVVAV